MLLLGSIVTIFAGILFTVAASSFFFSTSDNSDYFDSVFITSIVAIIFYILGGYLLYDYSKEESIKGYLNGEYVVDTLNVTQKGVVTDIKITDYKVKCE